MPTIGDLKQSKFISKNDLGPQQMALYTIRGWEDVTAELESEVPKYALLFEETNKPFVVNVTNAREIGEITGDEDFDNWTGAKIVLYYDKNITFGQKKTGGIRVRAPKTGGGRAPMPPAAPPRNPVPPRAPAPVRNYMEPEPEYAGGDDSDLPF